jgi:hypothetical protein
MSAIFLALESPADVERAAQRLIAEAERLGLVLTIEQVPLKPLAMGHYESVVSVMPARKAAAQESAP